MSNWPKFILIVTPGICIGSSWIGSGLAWTPSDFVEAVKSLRGVGRQHPRAKQLSSETEHPNSPATTTTSIKAFL